MQSKSWKVLALVGVATLLLGALGACGSATPEAEHALEQALAELEAVSLDRGEKLRVVATTNILGDVVKNVGGDRIDLTVLMGIGVDPHSYVATPADTAAIHDAHVVLASGGGLEADLEEVFQNAGGEATHIQASQGLEWRPLPGGQTQDAEHAEGAEAAAEHDHNRGDLDPHVWFSVPNVIHWVQTIENTLSALDPANSQVYEENARAYTGELEELDAWILEQIVQIPEANRKLVTSHPAFGYFADRYGLEQVGAVYPVSPSSEPSAQDIAVLEDAIREVGVPAVFAESTVNTRLAQQVAQDTGVKLVPLHTGSLGEPGSGAESYIQLIRYDVAAIVESLR